MPFESQPGVLGDPPPLARSLTFRLRVDADAAAALSEFVRTIPAAWVTLGIGKPLALSCGRSIAGLPTFPGLSGAAATAPSTQGALWMLLRGADHTELYKREAGVRAALASAFVLDASLDAFERILHRMLGLDDGIVDALFTFSRPITGGYYWCPSLRSGAIDLSALIPKA